MTLELNLNGIWTVEFFGNTFKEYFIALAVFFVIIAVLKIVKFRVIKVLKKLTKRTKSEFDDFIITIIDEIGWLFYVLISVFVAAQFLELPGAVSKTIYYAVLIAGTYYVFMGIHHIIDFGTKHVIKKREEKEKDSSAIHLLGKLLKFATWIIAVLLILSNIGYDITTLVAGLGIGGLAIAFALQNILTDIFASFSIYFDKPFKPGDFIIVGGDMGTVKHIGIKSTRLKSIDGPELVISNKELTEARIQNYKKMQKRRVLFRVGVTYQTPAKKLKKIPGMIKKIIGKVKDTEADRVHFREFGDSALIFEVVYYMNVTDYAVHMDAKQAINIAMVEAFKKEKIEFAYPTQTLFLEKAK